MTLGDLVLVNAFMIQLYIPLNFLGVMYREIKQALTDMERMFGLLEQNREIADAPGAPAAARRAAATVRFEHVDFGYDADRQILHDVSFDDPGRARRSRWSGRRARASRRWRGCCSASTTSTAGASRSTARTSAR